MELIQHSHWIILDYYIDAIKGHVGEPTSATHTMRIDHLGQATYNPLPDKIKAPEMYG